MQAKLFLLLQTEQYNTALDLVSSLADPAAREFERTYALYRLHRENEAAELLPRLKALEGTDEMFARGVMHLEAQLVRLADLFAPSLFTFHIDLMNLKAYRQCAYQEAFDLYTQLLDSSSLVRALIV